MSLPWTLTDPLIVDRAAERRDLDMAHADAVVVRDGAVLAADGRLVELPPAERPEASLTLYLGRDGDRDLVAVVPADATFGVSDDGIGSERLVGLRDLLRAFSERTDADAARDRELASTAVAIATWHANHPRCSLCGAVTEPVHGGWVRRCDADSREHYPRTDPAVIVAITDPDDRLLIAHASYWSARRYSHLAGYVEPGESLEQAARREVGEEAGLSLASLAYVASQPWPFPASVMVGFKAMVEDTELRLDQDEITDARWVTREELPALVAEGNVILPPGGSIARWMLDDWLKP
ncbi:NAD(+) diphosphatase [Demequina sp.]|uniref:NAD(+) diphosphatase n=1 Tax=Demequina sp. TaxID=2050685 RepID=UPI003D131AB7